MDLETEWFLNELTPLLSSTVVMLVSDHGMGGAVSDGGWWEGEGCMGGKREGGGEEANVEECEGCERKVKSKGGEGGSEAEGKGTQVGIDFCTYDRSGPNQVKATLQDIMNRVEEQKDSPKKVVMDRLREPLTGPEGSVAATSDHHANEKAELLARVAEVEQQEAEAVARKDWQAAAALCCQAGELGSR